MEEKMNPRSSLILKLSRGNVEVHNVDQTIWKIQRRLFDTETKDSSIAEARTESDIQDENSNKENITCNTIESCEVLENEDKDDKEENRSGTEKRGETNENEEKDMESYSSSSSNETAPEPFGSGTTDIDSDYENAPSSSSSSGSEIMEVENELEELQDATLIENSPPKKRGRKRKQNQKNWKRNISKRLRNSGLSYESVKVTRKGNEYEKKVVKRGAKTILPPCGEKCRLKCSEKLTEESRKRIFKEYWEMGDLQRQRDFISASMQTVLPKYRYENGENRRRENHAFYFMHNKVKLRICKKMFMSVLAINTRIIRTIIEKQERSSCGIAGVDMRGKHDKHKGVPSNMKEAVRSHIKSIPRIESHYCRAQTKKEYIEGTKTIAELHRDYEALCKQKGTPSANYQMYFEIFTKEFNISFFRPKKDACELCLQYENSQEAEKDNLKEKYDCHLKEKIMSRAEKENDKMSNKHTYVYDLQSVLPCPTGNASSFYYVSKLNVYDFTISNLYVNQVFCYVWHEAEAHRGSNEIGSCLLNFLENLDAQVEESDGPIDVIFYSDNCSGQNKNRYIFSLYFYAVLKFVNINSITHKFLITGHTQNEGDNVHSVIEKQITRYKKSAPIYGPDQYVTLIRQAKKTGNAYNVIEMTHDNFYDFKDLAERFGIKAAYKNDKGEAVKISEMKVFRITKDQMDTFFYKYSYQEQQYSNASFVNIRRKLNDNENVMLKKAYKKKLGLSEAKKRE